ncbi:MAG: 30S ribosomal protein S2 [Candidatus Pacearchaeota archaeon]
MPRKKKTEETKIEEKIEEVIEKPEEVREVVEDKPKKEKEEVGEKEGEKIKEKEVLLVPLEEYIKAAVHLGTRAITPDMRQYVYRRKADGIAVLNTKKIDEKIAVAAKFLAQFEPKDMLVCCKREVGWKSLEAFKEALGDVKIFMRYPAGIITNSDLENFFEPKVLFIVDPWLDKNALHDATRINIPVVALCDTNNVTTNIDIVVPCNNKAPKSIGLVLYLIAKLYLEKKGIKKKLNPRDFYEIEESEVKETAGRKRLKEELLKRIQLDEEKKESEKKETKEKKEREAEKESKEKKETEEVEREEKEERKSEETME